MATGEGDVRASVADSTISGVSDIPNDDDLTASMDLAETVAAPDIESTPEPTLEPTPKPEPEPAPAPEPPPAPAPESESEPEPSPGAEPSPGPEPAPKPGPEPAPEAELTTDPPKPETEASAKSEPEVEPTLAPEPTSELAPEANAAPGRESEPDAAADAGEPTAAAAPASQARVAPTGGVTVEELATSAVDAPLSAVRTGYESLARRLRGTKAPPGCNPGLDLHGEPIKAPVAFVLTLQQAVGVPAGAVGARSARASIVDARGRLISNLHRIPLSEAAAQPAGTTWAFDAEAAANQMCLTVAPQEDLGEDGAGVGSAFCVELLLGDAVTTRLAFAKLPLTKCFEAARECKGPLSVVLCNGGTANATPLEGDAHSLSMAITRIAAEDEADAQQLPPYVVLPVQSVAMSAIFRKIATEDSRAYYASSVDPQGWAAQERRERLDEDGVTEVEPPSCTVSDPAMRGNGAFYHTMINLMDNLDPSVLGAVSAAWQKRLGSLPAETQQDAAASAAEYKAMVRQLLPVTQLVLPDTKEGLAQRVELVDKLLLAASDAPNDTTALAALLLSPDYVHRPLQPSELDTPQELIPLEIPTPPPSPKNENYGKLPELATPASQVVAAPPPEEGAE